MLFRSFEMKRFNASEVKRLEKQGWTENTEIFGGPHQFARGGFYITRYPSGVVVVSQPGQFKTSMHANLTDAFRAVKNEGGAK